MSIYTQIDLETKQILIKRRVYIYLGTFTLLISSFLYFALSYTEYYIDANLNTLLETITAVLVIVIGLFALIRYYTKKEPMLFYIGIGFIGAFLLNAFHIIVTSTNIIYIIPSNSYGIFAWTWLFARLFLATFLSISWVHWYKEKKENKSIAINEKKVYVFTSILILILFVTYTLVQLPAVYLKDATINRPLELIPGVLFFLSLLGFIHKKGWQTDIFEHCLILFLIINSIIQTLVISTSENLYDTMFGLTSGLRISSFFILFIGLLRNTSTLYKESEHRKNLLESQNDILLNTQIELKHAIQLAENSMKAKDQFLAHASHEIRNPLNGIIGLTRILLTTPLNEDQKKYMTTMKESSDTLMAVINNILDHSKIESGKILIEEIKFDIKLVVEAVKELLSFRSTEKNIKLHIEIDEYLPQFCIGDPVRLKQILLNLTDNAIKFTNKGEVKIKVDLIKENKNDMEVRFTVKDTGIGIPEKKLEMIFESYAQANLDTTRKYGGSGLGLTITKKLVELQGGTIHVKSIYKKGTTFFIDMKYKKYIEGTIDKKDDYTDMHADNIRILFIEDNSVNQMITKVALEDYGFSIEIASNGKEGLEILKQHSFDLILMDVQMPIMDGYQATQHIRKDPQFKKYSTIPILGITAYSTKSEAEKCISSGMNDYVLKPFNPRDLYTKIIRLLNDQSTEFSIKDSRISDNNTKSANVIDLDYLRSITKNRSDLTKDMIKIFLDQLKFATEEIKKYLIENNILALKALAHKMKSSAGIMGIVILEDNFNKLETLCIDNKNIHEIASVCNTIISDSEKIILTLKEQILI